MGLTQVSTDGVKDDAIDASKLPANSVGASELADNSVDSAALSADCVIGSKIADQQIATEHIADQAVALSKLPHGDGSSDGKFLRANNGADPTFETVNTDLVSDTSPQLGGDLQTNGNHIGFADNNKARFGSGNDLDIYHNGTDSYIDNGTGDFYIRGVDEKWLYIQAKSGENSILCKDDGAVELYHDNVKQAETHESGIILPKAVVRGMGGSKAILGGSIDPSQDKTWNLSFSTNAHGYNNGYVFQIKFYLNHWNSGDYFKYFEALRGGRGNVTSLVGHYAVENVGNNGDGWNNGHLDFSVSLSGGTMNGSSAALFKVKYDADGTPAWNSGYYLEVVHSGQIGQVTIT